ncbi:hypothetical protein KI688_009186 [Linnemannia hyalina]|uniref:Arrestin C-terminal-like domain-containing protein n=1 Tax=Linnemannia hyalina TaxID=64524 RepID=A0A9P7XZ71_9FUNG|nr:hypothetical protein KI688_009186 [Linnemannia hyalina]
MTAIAPQASYTGHFLCDNQISPPGSPPDSPPFYFSSSSASAVDDSTEIHSDDLPPAFSSVGTTPAPSDDHSDMVSHHSEIVVVDEESFHNIRHHPSSTTPTRASSPAPPRTTATTLSVVHRTSPLSNSFTPAETEVMLSSPVGESSSSRDTRSLAAANSAVTSFFSSPPPAVHHNRHDHHTIPSPFSFFAHTPHSHGDHPVPQHIKTLRIEVANKDIVLTTGKTTLLEGTLYLTLQKTTKIKTLNLEFSGHSSFTWVDDNAYSPATRFMSAPHIEHTWPLIAHQHKQPSTVLQTGQHAFPFSLELPDNLPETMTTTHGKVVYRLTANLTKPGISFSTTTATTSVCILRRYVAEGPLSRAYQRGGRLVNDIDDKVKYRIALPQIRFPHSMRVPLQVAITSPNNEIAVEVLQVGLWERVVYRADEQKKRIDMRLVKIQKSGGWPHVNAEGLPTTEPVTWSKVLLFEMPELGPERSSQCNPSCDNGLMKVTHHLRFTILGFDGVKRFRLENELEVKVLAFEDESPAFSDGLEMQAFGENGEPLSELPSYLTSFSTPRVSFNAERDAVPTEEDDDVLRALVARIHLPTYAESEEDTHSRDNSRNGSRTASPERSPSTTTTSSHIRMQSDGSSSSSSSQ